MLKNIVNIRILSDLAFKNKEWQASMLVNNNVEILSSLKSRKNNLNFFKIGIL